MYGKMLCPVGFVLGAVPFIVLPMTLCTDTDYPLLPMGIEIAGFAAWIASPFAGTVGMILAHRLGRRIDRRRDAIDEILPPPVSN